MVGNPRRRASKRNAERRRALELLAASPDGCTEAIILAHGFTTDFLVGLICAGLATGQGAVPPGSRTVNTEPLPGSLVTVTSPPIMRASLRERARPSPVPP